MLLSYYKVTLTYKGMGPHSINRMIGVVARDLEEAITLAKGEVECETVRIYSAAHQGRVDVVTHLE